MTQHANMAKAKAQFYKIVKAGRKLTYNTRFRPIESSIVICWKVPEQFSPERRKLISRCFIWINNRQQAGDFIILLSVKQKKKIANCSSDFEWINLNVWETAR